MFIAPAMIVLAVFTLFPIILAFVVSFTDLNLRGLGDWSRIEFVGFYNYLRLLRDPGFYNALVNTVFYVVVGVPLVVGFALGFALLVNFATTRLFQAYRAMFFLPAITNIVAVALIWGYLYNTNFGLINHILSWGGVQPVPWLDQPLLARISLIIVGVWQGAGFNMLIFLAALQGIPRDLYEAADLDGAGPIRKLIFITVPMLRFATFFVAVTTMISWIQFFETPLVLTGGGPLDGTVSMALFIYQNGFAHSRYGYASAASFVLFAIVVLVTLIQFCLRRGDAND